ncbi:hypothetical protein Tco_1090849 [Tanacetum coccineum]|uniref:Uncharacterized protein n=1 Tax=Tanacetum coccineum TaxID=301880 RepID=A0ABQ5I5K8_9ASTR
MKQWEELIRENVFGLGGHRDHLSACLAHMLYYVVDEEQYNLAYFFVKRIECARANPTANLPYGHVSLTIHLSTRHEAYPSRLDNGIYNYCSDRVMRPFALKQPRRTRSDREAKRHNTPVSLPPPSQDNASMDITLTLSLNTLLDVQFDTPSPSPPIIAHPIPWNFLEVHDWCSARLELEHLVLVAENVIKHVVYGFRPIREFVDIVKKTLEFGARGVDSRAKRYVYMLSSSEREYALWQKGIIVLFR